MKILYKDNKYIIQKERKDQIIEEDILVNKIYIFKVLDTYEIGKLVKIDNNEIIFDCSKINEAKIISLKLEDINFITLK